MRFRTRDLLLLTTIFAAYAAMLIPFLRKQHLDVSFQPRFTWLFILGFAGSLLRAYLGRRAFAKRAKRFRRSRMDWLHLAPVAATLFALIRYDPAWSSLGFWGAAATIALSHFGFGIFSHILVRKAGILTGNNLLSWRDFNFTVEQNQLVCTPVPNPRKCSPKRYTLYRHDAEELKELLATKQAPNEGH